MPEKFSFRLKEWTEIGFPELCNKACCGVGFTVGSVIGHPEFVKNPHKASFDVWQSKGCDLAANGAVMRTSVIGIPFFFNESQVVLNAINCAKVTHADPRCIFSSVVVSALISRILREELEIDEKYDNDKERLLKVSESTSTNCNRNEGQNSDMLLADLCIPKALKEEKPPTFLQSMCTRKQKSVSMWPNYKESDASRLKTYAKCSNDPSRFSTASCGHDEHLMALVEGVVSDYKFLINTNDDSIKLQWTADMERLCFPKSLPALELDKKSSIGYTIKCLGSALFCLSRRKTDEMGKGEFFMRVITELTLEAGDADTNCAVAGALLGARLGFKELPRVWLSGLRNREFLTDICDELLELVMKQLMIQSKHVVQNKGVLKS